MLDIERELKLLAEYKIDCVIIGGIAARAHGSSYETTDVDVCYARDPQNLDRLATALLALHATLRGAPKNIPFRLDAETLGHGLNFTFETDFGALDLVAEVRGVGGYQECMKDSIEVDLFGNQFYILALDKLIVAKRTAGRAKDLSVLAELDAILEYERIAQAQLKEEIDDRIKTSEV